MNNIVLIGIISVVVIGIIVAVVMLKPGSGSAKQTGSAGGISGLQGGARANISGQCNSCVGTTVHGIPCPVYTSGGCQPPCRCRTSADGRF